MNRADIANGKQHDASQRAMIADNLLRFYRDEAKGRQTIGTNQHTKSLPQKVAEPKNSEAREAAGKAAGVNHTYVDKASDPEALADFREAMKGQGKRNDIPNILYNIKEVQAGTGKAAGVNHTYVDKASDPEALADFREAVTGEPHRPKKESGYNITSNERVTGTGKAYTLSRLKRETPELFERVKAGDPQRRSALIGWRWVRRCLRRDTGQRRAMAMALGRGLLYLETKGEATIAGLLRAGSTEHSS